MDNMNGSLSMGQFGGTGTATGSMYNTSPLDPSKQKPAGMNGPLGSSGTPGAIGNSSSGLTGSFGMGAGGMGSGGIGV